MWYRKEMKSNSFFPFYQNWVLEYSMFVSTFHATKLAMGAAWKMPPMDDFVESLTHEKDKIVQMGSSSPQRHMHLQQMRSLATNSNKNSKARKTQI
jgi:hypothetical protein